MAEKKKRTLLFNGFITFGIALMLNSILVALSIGGLVRELARLTVLIGFLMIFIGLIIKVVKFFKNVFS